MAPPRGKRFRAPQRPAAPGVPRAARAAGSRRWGQQAALRQARPPTWRPSPWQRRRAAVRMRAPPCPTVSSPVFKSPPPCARALAVGSAGRGRAAMWREAAPPIGWRRAEGAGARPVLPSHWLAAGAGRAAGAAAAAAPLRQRPQGRRRTPARR